MIAQIELDSQLFLPREEAKELGLSFTEIDARYGILRHNKEVKIPSGGEKFVDEFFLNIEDGYLYLTEEFVEKEQRNNWYILDRIPEEKLSWVIVEKEQLVALLKFAPVCKAKYRVIKCVQSPASSAENMATVVYQLDQKLKSLSTLLDVQNSFNERCDVHIGGHTITTYNEVKLCEDLCTDALQTELTHGWRMIAVCVQKDQRRPDYILGRWNPDMGLDTAAKR